MRAPLLRGCLHRTLRTEVLAEGLFTAKESTRFHFLLKLPALFRGISMNRVAFASNIEVLPNTMLR